MTRCQACNGTHDLWTSDDATIVLCLQCIKAIVHYAEQPTLAETWWKWMQGGLRGGRTSAS